MKFYSFYPMRTLITVTITFLSISSIAQTSIDKKDIDKEAFRYIDSLGIDSNSKLNNFESNYLNTVFSKRNIGFDFSNKNIAFVTGSSGKTITNKQAYFRLEKQRVDRNYSLNGGQVILFSDSEKMKSGGYDAAIVYWSKVRPSKKGLIKRLNKKSS